MESIEIALRKYYEELSEKADKGIVSPLSRLEMIAIESFAFWYDDRRRSEQDNSLKEINAKTEILDQLLARIRCDHLWCYDNTKRIYRCIQCNAIKEVI